jgi:hypothetical protein
MAKGEVGHHGEKEERHGGTGVKRRRQGGKGDEMLHATSCAVQQR